MFLVADFQGKASLDIANLRGDTPLKMLQLNTGSIWIGQKVMDRIREEGQVHQRRNFLLRLTLDKVRLTQHSNSKQIYSMFLIEIFFSRMFIL